MVEEPRVTGGASASHVVLAGPRAVGKTTIGKLLASTCDLPFVDLDDRSLDRFPETTVKQVWEAHGESAWREAETASLKAVLGESRSVIALGGGVPTIPAARDLLDGPAAMVIWLQADASILAARLSAGDDDRPSLTGRSPADEIAEVCRQRESDYQAIADHVIDAGQRDAAMIAQSIKSMLFMNQG